MIFILEKTSFYQFSNFTKIGFQKFGEIFFKEVTFATNKYLNGEKLHTFYEDISCQK